MAWQRQMSGAVQKALAVWGAASGDAKRFGVL